MPVLYGEGPRAFQRLREEIMKITKDHIILTWIDPTGDKPGHYNSPWDAGPTRGILATSPDQLPRYSGHGWSKKAIRYSKLYSSISHVIVIMAWVVQFLPRDWAGDPSTLTSRGLKMNLRVRRKGKSEYQASLTCTC